MAAPHYYDAHGRTVTALLQPASKVQEPVTPHWSLTTELEPNNG